MPSYETSCSFYRYKKFLEKHPDLIPTEDFLRKTYEDNPENFWYKLRCDFDLMICKAVDYFYQDLEESSKLENGDV
jgi:hypothetical protein